MAVLVAAGAAAAGTAVYFELRKPSAAQTTNLVDDLGRAVAAPIEAHRIVVLAPSIMDTVYRLGLRDRVVGVGCTPSGWGGMEAEYAPNQSALWNLTPSLCIPDFPRLGTEQVASLMPDLVLASTITSSEDLGILTDTYHLPVVVLAPSTLEGIVGDVKLLAQLFPSVATDATALEVALDRTLTNASSFDYNLSIQNASIPTVLIAYFYNSSGYNTYGSGSFGESLVDLAGGSSLAGCAPFAYCEMNGSYVLANPPDLLLYGTVFGDAYIAPDLTNWTNAPYWSQIPSDKIPVDANLLTEADPTMVLALPWFEYYLHPTLVPEPTTPPP